MRTRRGIAAIRVPDASVMFDAPHVVPLGRQVVVTLGMFDTSHVVTLGWQVVVTLSRQVVDQERRWVPIGARPAPRPHQSSCSASKLARERDEPRSVARQSRHRPVRCHRRIIADGRRRSSTTPGDSTKSLTRVCVWAWQHPLGGW